MGSVWDGQCGAPARVWECHGVTHRRKALCRAAQRRGARHVPRGAVRAQDHPQLDCAVLRRQRQRHGQRWRHCSRGRRAAHEPSTAARAVAAGRAGCSGGRPVTGGEGWSWSRDWADEQPLCADGASDCSRRRGSFPWDVAPIRGLLGPSLSVVITDYAYRRAPVIPTAGLALELAIYHWCDPGCM
jgi:hypothetical protein